MQRIPTEKLFIYCSLVPSLFVIVSKSHSRRSVARFKLLQEENGGNMSDSWREESLLCWTTESVACCLQYLGEGELRL